MSTWTQLLFQWLADYYLLATVLLALALAAGRMLRQPVQRDFLATVTVLGLMALAILCATPTWPRLSLAKSNFTAPIQDRPHAPSIRPPEIIVRQPREEIFKSIVPPRTILTSAPQPIAPAPSSTPAPRPALLESQSIHIDVYRLIAGGFVVGAATVSVWLLIGSLRVRRFCRLSQSAPEFAQRELEQIVGAARSMPQLLISHLIDIAAACGLLRPTILLPVPAINSPPTLSPLHPFTSSPAHTPLRALLAHEYAHIRRGDLWMLAASRLLLVVLFAHPLYWLLRRRMRADQELLADAQAAQVCGHYHYAESLYTWARHLPEKRLHLAGAIGIWQRPGQLSRRIAMLLDERIRPQISCPRLWRFSVTALMIAMVTASSLVTLRPTPVAKADSPENATVEKKMPNDQVVARVDSEAILAGDLKAFVHQFIEDRKLDIQPSQFEEYYEISARPLLKQLIELKMVYYDAMHYVPVAGMTKIQANINDEFAKKQVPALIKAAAFNTKEELDTKLRQTGRSLDWERRHFLERQLYQAWIAQQIKLEGDPPLADILGYFQQHRAEFESFETAQDGIRRILKDENRESQIIKFLNGLREKTSVWTIFDNQPGGLDGPPAAKTDAPKAPDQSSVPSADASTTLSTSEKLPLQSAQEPPEKVAITGICLDERKKPIPNALVRLFRVNHSNTPLELPSMRVQIHATFPGAKDVESPGLCSNPRYYASASQRVLRETRSDAEGKFRFDDVVIDESVCKQSDLMQIVAQSSGYATYIADVCNLLTYGRTPVGVDGWVPKDAAQGAAAKPLELMLKKAAVLQGRIVDEAGKPVAGAIVTGPESLVSPVPGVMCAGTDADGRYEINDLPPFNIDNVPLWPPYWGGPPVTYISQIANVRHPDYAPQLLEFSKLPATVDAVLERPAALEGRVVLSENGQGVAEARINVMTRNGAGYSTITDKQGSYSLAGLLPGKCSVTAQISERPIASSESQLEPGKNSHDLRLVPGGFLKGRVIDDTTGKPLELHQPAIIATVGEGDSARACVGYPNYQDGTFSFAVHPGKNQVTIFAGPMCQLIDADRWSKTGIDVAQGQTVEIELRVSPPWLVRQLGKLFE